MDLTIWGGTDAENLRKIIFAMSFRFHIFAIGSVLVTKPYIFIKRSVYARLVGENVRSFQKMARECNGSRVSRGLVAISSIKGISHNLHLEKWHISTTLLLCRNLPVGYWWAGKTNVEVI